MLHTCLFPYPALEKRKRVTDKVMREGKEKQRSEKEEGYTRYMILTCANELVIIRKLGVQTPPTASRLDSGVNRSSLTQ
jgi:hypothetical protein